MKRYLIWFAAAAVAMPLVLPVTNANAQCGDDRPHLGETTLEYNTRMTAQCAGQGVRELQGLRGAAESIDRRYGEALDDAKQAAKEERARARRRHEIACNRLSQRSALKWSESAARLYEDYCAD
jgi:hypothetical protein